MITHIFTGFDSAWANNPKRPGAITSIIQRSDGSLHWQAAKLVSFKEAAEEVNRLASQSPWHLVAIDQPTIVPNQNSCRPVERVAGSLVNKLKGGVQPANRSKSNIFGDDAPIWQFLNSIPHIQTPNLARLTRDYPKGESVNVIMEVFPALSIPSLIPAFFDRNYAAKYNPENKKTFSLEDWQEICKFLYDYARAHKIIDLDGWALQLKEITLPRKADQDKLDAALCAVIAYHWVNGRTEGSLIIGDPVSGYMVTPVYPKTREILLRSAIKNNVHIDMVWTETELQKGFSSVVQPVHNVKPSTPSVSSEKKKVTSHSLTKVKPINLALLEKYLVSHAKKGRTVTYGMVLKYFNNPVHQGAIAHLAKLLDTLAEESIRLNSANLAALVVNKSEGLPGKGFFKHTDVSADATKSEKQKRLTAEIIKLKILYQTDEGMAHE